MPVGARKIPEDRVLDPMVPVFKTAELTQVDDNEFEFVASDETVDRYGDIVRVEGWKLANYRKNPIVLFAHNHSLPVGYSPKVWKDDKSKSLMSRIKFAAKGTTPFIDGIRALAEQKILKAVSVGFIPTKDPVPLIDRDDRFTGYEFIEQELLEISLVSVPANPAALNTVKSMGIDPRVLSRIFQPSADATVFLRRMRMKMELIKAGASARIPY